MYVHTSAHQVYSNIYHPGRECTYGECIPSLNASSHMEMAPSHRQVAGGCELGMNMIFIIIIHIYLHLHLTYRVRGHIL